MKQLTRVNLQNTQTTQYQEKNQSKIKKGKRPKETFFQTYRWLTNTTSLIIREMQVKTTVR